MTKRPGYVSEDINTRTGSRSEDDLCVRHRREAEEGNVIEGPDPSVLEVSGLNAEQPSAGGTDPNERLSSLLVGDFGSPH